MSLCTIINAHVTDQVIQLSNLPRIASGSKNALQIRCNFCGKWEGCGKTAVFYRTEDEVYHVPVVEGLVTVPWEVLVDEGYFWLGFMGEDDLTRTTEAIRIEVAKGALTVATATPQEPTPDIYQQIMAAYGTTERMLALEKARLDELVAMRTDGGAGKYKFEDDVHDAAAVIITNGAVAKLLLDVRGVMVAKGEYYTFASIPQAFAPMADVFVRDHSFGDNIVVTIHSEPFEGRTLIVFLNRGEETTIAGECELEYPLATLYVPEVTDARAGYDNNGDETYYDTAGAAVRASQQMALCASDMANNIENDMGKLHNRVAVLENGGRGITAEQIAAIQRLFEIAAYTEDARDAYQAFVDAFACQHEYDDDCDATCNLCGAVRDTAHVWDEGVVTKEPDYGVDGEMIYTCTICGATKTEVIPALVPPVLTAVYSPRTPQNLRVNFDYADDSAEAIRDWLTVTDEDGNAITDYTLSKNADGDVVVSYQGATATVAVERNKVVITSGVGIKRGSTSASYTSQGAGSPYTSGDYSKLVHPYFITAKGGYCYTFEVKLTDAYYANNAERGNPRFVVEWYNSNTMDTVASQGKLTGYGDETTGWQPLPDGLTYTYTPQAIINGYPLSAFRFVMQKPEGDTEGLTGAAVESITIAATPVAS